MKKCFSLVMSLMLILGLIISNTNSVSAIEGDGTENNPYLISNASELLELSGKSNVYAKLTNDIDLSQVSTKNGGWYKYYLESFSGILDGNGHKFFNAQDQSFVISTFINGEIKNLEFNLNSVSSLVLEQKASNDHVYNNLKLSGEIEYTSNNNNESPLVVYADGNTTFKNVNISTDITSPTYHGIFIGYMPVKNSNYIFENCEVSGNIVCSDVGVLFGNGSISATSDYGLHHLLEITEKDPTSTLVVEGLKISGSILSLSNPVHYLCGIGYQDSKFGTLETTVVNNTNVTGIIKQADPLDGYDFIVNNDGNLKIKISQTNENVGSFVVVSEVYANCFTNGVANGTQKTAVSERIDVLDNVTEYYSSLGKVRFYDGIAGTLETTGENGSIQLITVGDQTYYRLIETSDLLTFGNTNAVTNTSKLSSAKVYVYDKNGKLMNIVNGPQAGEFEMPKLSLNMNTGDKVGNATLTDGWTWVNSEKSVVSGGQIVFAKKDNMIAPVKIVGKDILATIVELSPSKLVLETENTAQLKTEILPENTTNKELTWTSSDEKVATVDENGKVTAVSAGIAIITAETSNGLKATCEVTVKEHNVVAPVLPEKPTENIAVAPVVDANAEKMLKESANKEFENKLESALDIETEVLVKNLEETTVSKTDVTAVESKIETLTTSTKKVEVAQYLDLSILVTADGEKVGNITETSQPLTFQVKVPNEMLKEGRTFDVIRVHDGKAEVLDSIFKDGIITFETDKFSTYAIVYTDIVEPTIDVTPTTPTEPSKPTTPTETTKPVETPEKGGKVETGDNSAIALYGSICALAVVGAGIVVLKKKREELLNK